MQTPRRPGAQSVPVRRSLHQSSHGAALAARRAALVNVPLGWLRPRSPQLEYAGSWRSSAHSGELNWGQRGSAAFTEAARTMCHNTSSIAHTATRWGVRAHIAMAAFCTLRSCDRKGPGAASAVRRDQPLAPLAPLTPCAARAAPRFCLRRGAGLSTDRLRARLVAARAQDGTSARGPQSAAGGAPGAASRFWTYAHQPGPPTPPTPSCQGATPRRHLVSRRGRAPIERVRSRHHLLVPTWHIRPNTCWPFRGPPPACMKIPTPDPRRRWWPLRSRQ